MLSNKRKKERPCAQIAFLSYFRLLIESHIDFKHFIYKISIAKDEKNQITLDYFVIKSI